MTIPVGTAATNTLTGMVFNPAGAASDFATIMANIKYDQNPGGAVGQVYPGAWSQRGVLYVPSRGFLLLLPGDVVAYDTTGWPIALSQKAAASASWVT